MTAMQDLEIGRLIYLTLLGAAILAGVLAAYRGRMGAGLRDALTWGLIFVGLIAAYGLKDDVSRALNPQAASLLPEGGVALRRAADGHFHMEAEVNGVPVTFLVDTGATQIVLTRRDAERAGIDPERLAYTSRSMTANGPVSNAPVRLETLEAAGVPMSNVRAVVAGGDLFQSLLGMDFLERFRRISVEGDRLILTP
ncbi:MAG: TIGR02281 family clan AA aspartic protease [Pseudomonadota bacterium]